MHPQRLACVCLLMHVSVCVRPFSHVSTAIRKIVHASYVALSSHAPQPLVGHCLVHTFLSALRSFPPDNTVRQQQGWARSQGLQEDVRPHCFFPRTSDMYLRRTSCVILLKPLFPITSSLHCTKMSGSFWDRRVLASSVRNCFPCIARSPPRHVELRPCHSGSIISFPADTTAFDPACPVHCTSDKVLS